MKRYNYWFVIFLSILFTGNVFSQEWGDITNGVQISISLETNQPIKANGSIVISFKIRNTLTNEFYFYFRGSPEASFSYKIITPSGKEPPRNTDVILTGFSTGPRRIFSKETKQYDVNLNLLYRFNEIGTYRIIGKTKVESLETMLLHGDTTFDENKAFDVISNPLDVTLVP